MNYTVKTGDNLTKIASIFGVPISAITGYRSGNPNKIYPGEVLTISKSTPITPTQTPITPAPTTSTPVTTNNLSQNLPEPYAELYNALKEQLTEIQKRGQTINPKVEITPEKVAEFLSQAEKEINPYYQTQLKLAKEGFLKSLGYSQGEILNQEQELERKYGRSLTMIGENAAETGFAQSGKRMVAEQELAQDTQSEIDASRRQLAFGAGNAARTFAQTYGMGELNTPTIDDTPTVQAGQMKFTRASRQMPLYELSPSTYEGLVGSKEFERRGAVRSRTSELEQAFRTDLASNQMRNLIL